MDIYGQIPVENHIYYILTRVSCIVLEKEVREKIENPYKLGKFLSLPTLVS